MEGEGGLALPEVTSRRVERLVQRMTQVEEARKEIRGIVAQALPLARRMEELVALLPPGEREEVSHQFPRLRVPPPPSGTE